MVSGFLAANLAWVVHYFTSPNLSTRSSTTELYAELAYIRQQRQNSTEDTYVISDREKDMRDWQSLWRQELELREAIKKYSILASSSMRHNIEAGEARHKIPRNSKQLSLKDNCYKTVIRSRFTWPQDWDQANSYALWVCVWCQESCQHKMDLWQ